MDQFKAGERVWYTSQDGEHVYRIAEIKGNVAILESNNPTGPIEKTEAYLTELKPHIPCTMENAIGRATCDFRH